MGFKCPAILVSRHAFAWGTAQSQGPPYGAAVEVGALAALAALPELLTLAPPRTQRLSASPATKLLAVAAPSQLIVVPVGANVFRREGFAHRGVQRWSEARGERAMQGGRAKRNEERRDGGGMGGRDGMGG